MIERDLLESQLQLTYRKDLDVLFLRWFKVPDSEGLRQGYMKALELAEEVGGSYWMFDLRSRGKVSEQDETWLLEEYFPMVEERLGQQNYFANLVMPSHYNYIEDSFGFEYLINLGKLTQLAVFTSEQEAVAWLLKSRADR
ncbi:hypothetical protein TH63_16940 [Rufibacter radiotolerans]|uniref:STAS/SEC14 domain-containing protein n=1 Tax=Rufibacter radiotolerans TaxID=1379910 RepID=A0A0H4VT14_9BACT|nr:hypothetical protein [Rufibacter radiotolerans]AKQ46939.1 hypothetical protein TH63_16940 [Rufibacter radiotolerans]